ncbi:CPBP family intramembrane glutamic endopeptidase [Sphingomonas sp. S2-65]|uniref:CPBP family intramembrane glutamic endopeptidase n=1 Tax=Sphingomonas sp. S2-65 TaxID=2903960 RepID=UPI001F416D7C|nr:CPBP family intramembrane glutamic endopeptidase [Sphingomonas sp. S2-65]UYY57202.1 CPBP family intramembrane metalloprotease [Sphingomonas sp. S2-65]
MKEQAAAGVSLAAASGAMAAILLAGPGLVTALVPTDASEAVQEAAFVLPLFGAMIVVALAGGLVLRRKVTTLGALPARNAAIGFALGLLGIGLAAGYAAIAGVAQLGAGGNGGARLLAGMALVLFQAAAEELYFRGWLQPVLVRAWGVVPGIAVTALAFAALHMLGAAFAPLSFVNLLLGGLLFGTLAARAGGIAGALAAHFAWNSTEQLVLGLDPNPGVGSFGALFDLDLAGAAAWGGSGEGLNASVAMTVALLVLVVPLAILAHGARDRA